MIYAEKEPFGEQRADLRSAIVACTIANIWRGKNQPAMKPIDFMPFAEKPQVQEGLTGKAGALVASHLFRHAKKK